MATRAQIARLQQRIEQTVAALEPRPPRKVVHVIHDPMVDGTEEAALARHFAEHPEDRNPTDLIITRIIHPHEWQTDGHASAN